MAQKDSVSLSKFEGLRNTVASERLSPGELEVAVNVDIDDAGELRRRRGTTRVATGSHHSLFRAGDDRHYVVKNGALCRLFPNYSTQLLKLGIGQDPLSYVKVGEDVYFSSRSQSGVINEHDVVSNWGAYTDGGTWLSPVLNPSDSLPAVRGKLLGAPPLATSLAYFNGRIYLANERTLWATELYLYNYVDKTKNFIFFESNITGIGAVTDGIYVGTEEAVFFLSGPFNEMRRIHTVDAGMIAGSVVDVPPEFVGAEESQSKNAILFMTTLGLYMGLDGGDCMNLTKGRVEFPRSDVVAPLFRRQDGLNTYIGVADSAGTPSSSARIGDYVDAEIRRFQGV